MSSALHRRPSRPNRQNRRSNTSKRNQQSRLLPQYHPLGHEQNPTPSEVQTQSALPLHLSRATARQTFDRLSLAFRSRVLQGLLSWWEATLRQGPQLRIFSLLWSLPLVQWSVAGSSGTTQLLQQRLHTQRSGLQRMWLPTSTTRG